MFFPVTINKELTLAKFGYNPEDLTKGTYKVVCVECSNCHKQMERPNIHAKRLHQCPIVKGSQKRCFKCEQWKDLTLFNKSPKLSGGVAKMCRECHNNHTSVKKCEKERGKKRHNSFKDDFSYWIKTKVWYVRTGSKSKKIICDLDEDYLTEQWNSQQGKCFYSGLTMKVEPKYKKYQSWLAPSLDKKIPELGYTKGNVVWACSCVNSFKNTMTDTEFINLLKTIKWNID